MRWPADRGAALGMVLVMLAVLSTLAVLAAEASRLSLRRTANLHDMAQARWYALAAERYALLRLDELPRGDEEDEPRVDQSVWQGRPAAFPLDEGGLMSITLWDAQNCFNLNSLVREEGDGLRTGNAAGQLQFARLLDVLNVRGEAPGLVATLTDWLDTDTAPRPGGLEDLPGAGGAAAYRPANGLMADVSELAKVRGFTPEIVARLSPHVCARASVAETRLNPNTLRPGDDALLAAIVGPPLTRSTAQLLIERRPYGGWPTMERFIAELPPVEEGWSPALSDQFTLTSSLFVARIGVRYRDAQETLVALLATDSGGRVVRRVFGPGLTERAV